MRIIKNINNNVAICVDSNGNEIVAFAKGIGFKKPPMEISLTDVERTFYHVDKNYIDMLKNADEKIVGIAVDIKQYSDSLNISTSSSLVFSLVDHISYAIERVEKGIYFALPITNDIPHLFPEEMKVGKYGIDLVKNRLGKVMPKEEASFIALNIVNAKKELENRCKKEEFVIKQCRKIISEMMSIVIDTESFNYSRFESHIRYLILRSNYSSQQYKVLLDIVEVNYPNEYNCAKKIISFLEAEGYGAFNNDEVLFLALHINRLCTRQSK